MCRCSPNDTFYSLFSAIVQVQVPQFLQKCMKKKQKKGGYMDIKWSEYDEADENKHLLFWMFEKRGESNANTPVSLSEYKPIKKGKIFVITNAFVIFFVYCLVDKWTGMF